MHEALHLLHKECWCQCKWTVIGPLLCVTIFIIFVKFLASSSCLCVINVSNMLLLCFRFLQRHQNLWSEVASKSLCQMQICRAKKPRLSRYDNLLHIYLLHHDHDIIINMYHYYYYYFNLFVVLGIQVTLLHSQNHLAIFSLVSLSNCFFFVVHDHSVLFWPIFILHSPQASCLRPFHYIYFSRFLYHLLSCYSRFIPTNLNSSCCVWLKFMCYWVKT